ncbi:uncharacterized protein LOC113981699 [Neopelma chrysocephalum]|uniref:uncharacterized protein LOC113981699 n=1 Tax=Neopelma chrysocephalum TaxID=114329 RepID=UPI000FCCFE09|nr:uncharacterized protein LOC113981699 [Neopelma chrysocephalum]
MKTVWCLDPPSKKSTKGLAPKAPKGLKVHYPSPHELLQTPRKYKSPTDIVPCHYKTPMELVEEFKAKQRLASSVPLPEEEEDEDTDENNEEDIPSKGLYQSASAPPAGTHIVQLVPFVNYVPRTEDQERHAGGFGSTGPPQVFWSQTVSHKCPQMVCELCNGKGLPSAVKMLDRGGFLLGVCILFCLGGTSSEDSYTEQLKRLNSWNSHNVWVTLMKALNQTTFCASLVKPELPFHMCLIGATVNNSDVVKLVSNVTHLPDLATKACNASAQSCIANVNDWLVKLSEGIAPQELDIFGTLTAAACFYFDYTGTTLSTVVTEPQCYFGFQQKYGRMFLIYESETLAQTSPCSETQKMENETPYTTVACDKGLKKTISSQLPTA